jgi:hypothetical protein
MKPDRALGARAPLRVVRLAPILLAAACASAAYVPPDDAAPTEVVTMQGEHSDHVVVISIDGLRPDAIAHFNARTLERLMAEGAWSLEATTIMPSKTLP